MRILSDDTCFILIDVQERLFPHIDQHLELLDKLKVLVQGIHLLRLPMLVTEQYTKGLGTTIPALAELLSEVEIFEKMSFSCCDEPRLMIKLHETQKQNVVLAGIEAHVCVLQTVLDLRENGYNPIVVADAVSSRRAFDKQIALDRIKREGGIITTTESLLLELCRTSATDTFKRISALIK